MWWSDEARGRRRGGAAVALLVVTLATAGCGFQPLYGRSADAGRSTVDELAQIRINPLRERAGQQFHNLLRDRLNPLGQPDRPAYLLIVDIDETVQELGIRADETATRANLRLTARFVLRPYASDGVLVRGQAQSVNSYNILQSQFATGVSENDARERGLRELSDEIRERLAVYFIRARRAS